MSENDSSPSASLPRRVPVLPILLILILLGMALFGEKGVLKVLQFSRQGEALRAEVKSLEEANAALREEIEALRSDRRYIEAIARKELGLVKEDERVYQFSSTGGAGRARTDQAE